MSRSKLTADRLSEVMDEAGVSRAVLVPPGRDADRNDFCLAAAQARPGRFAVMGRLQIERPDAPAKLEQMFTQKGMLRNPADFRA